MRDVTDGQVPVQGTKLIVLNLPPEEVFYPFTLHREWDLSEMSTGGYVSMLSQGDRSITALPVFVSRVFRQSIIYVADGSEITRPEQLRVRAGRVPSRSGNAEALSEGSAEHLSRVTAAACRFYRRS